MSDDSTPRELFMAQTLSNGRFHYRKNCILHCQGPILTHQKTCSFKRNGEDRSWMVQILLNEERKKMYTSFILWGCFLGILQNIKYKCTNANFSSFQKKKKIWMMTVKWLFFYLKNLTFQVGKILFFIYIGKKTIIICGVKTKRRKFMPFQHASELTMPACMPYNCQVLFLPKKFQPQHRQPINVSTSF